MNGVRWQARPSTLDDRQRRSLLSRLSLRRSPRDKGKQRASAELADVGERSDGDDELERLREAAARSVGLASLVPEAGADERDATLRRRPPPLELLDRQAARDEAAAKLCGLATSTPRLPLFPCAQSALAAHTQLSGPLLKHHPPTALARLVGAKAWKPRHAVLCTYSHHPCTCSRPHRSSADSACDAPTRTLACLHVFATPTPDALELARLLITEDSVVFVVEPGFSSDDARRGPRDIADRRWVIQVQGVDGAPPPPAADRQSKRVLSRRRESAGAATASLKSGVSGRPRTLASFSVGPISNSAPSAFNLTFDDVAQVHAVWFLQCPDADARQRWMSCIKRVVLLQRAERAGVGGTVHFMSPRASTEPAPPGDLDVVLALRAHAQNSRLTQLRASTSPPRPTPQPAVLSQPTTPVTVNFASGQTSSFVPVFSPTATAFSPTSPSFTSPSDQSHADALSLAFGRSQTPSIHTTHTAQTQPLPDRSRSRSSTVTSSAPIQALRGLFSLGSAGSRPPSRSGNVPNEKTRTRAISSSGGSQPPHPYTVASSGVEYPEGQSPIPTNLSLASALDQENTHPYSAPQLPPHPYSHLMLGAPISAGLGSMEVGERDRERDDLGYGGIGLNFGYPGAVLPGIGANGLPSGISSLPGGGKNVTGGSKGVTSLPPPPRTRRAGSISHVFPVRASDDSGGSGMAMGRVQEESPVLEQPRGKQPHVTEERHHEDSDHLRRPNLAPMLSLSFGNGEDLAGRGIDHCVKQQRSWQGEPLPDYREDKVPNRDESGPGQRESRVLPPRLAPPSAPLPVPPEPWPAASESSVSIYSVQTSSTNIGARTSDVHSGDGSDSRFGGPDTRSVYGGRVSFGDGLRPNIEAPWSRSHTSLEILRESPGASGTHSKVSLAPARGALVDHSERGSQDEYERTGTNQESPTRPSVRGSPVRGNGTRNSPSTGSACDISPITFARRSASDSVPSSPSSQVESSTREGVNAQLLFVREPFGPVASREVEGERIAHPFALQGQSQGRRARHRTGSYGGPTLSTIVDFPAAGRGRVDKPPPAPPPGIPLPPLPIPGPAPGATSSQTHRSPATQAPPAVTILQPRPNSLRTRFRMLSTPSPTPQYIPPEPPRVVTMLAENDLVKPISKIPISLLVRDDANVRKAGPTDQNVRREPEGVQSLPPPPRTRVRLPLSSDREGQSEGRRSDESSKTGARDSAVHLESRD